MHTQTEHVSKMSQPTKNTICILTKPLLILTMDAIMFCCVLKKAAKIWSSTYLADQNKHINTQIHKRFLHAILRNTRQVDSLPRMFKCSISEKRLKYNYDTKTGPTIWNLAYSIHLYLEDMVTKLLSGKAEATISSYLFRRAFIRTNMKAVQIHLWLK